MNDGLPMHRAPSEASPKDFLPLDELRWRLLAPPAQPLVLQLDLTDRADRRVRTILAQGMSKLAQLFRNGYLPIATRIREALVRNTSGQTMTEYALILAGIAIVVYSA